MEVVPCSRIGHLYRRSTYSFNGNDTEIIAQNSVRLVEVWMSDLKYLFYAVNPGIILSHWVILYSRQYNLFRM